MIKIYSDGTGVGTKVFMENGAEITGITKIIWEIDDRQPRLARF